MKFTVDSGLVGAFTSGDHVMTADEAMKTDLWRSVYGDMLEGGEDWFRITMADWTEGGIDWESERTRFYFRVYYREILKQAFRPCDTGTE